MSTLGLFIIGAAVTLVVGGAIVALIYAAMLDGRHIRDEQRRAGGLVPAATDDLSAGAVR